MITSADIEAAIAVLQQLDNETDDMDFDRAADLRRVVTILKGQAGVTIDLLEGEMLRQVEGAPRVHGGKTFMAVNKYRDRDDHDAVEAAIVREARARAVDRETGEIDPAEAARWAAHLMREAYVSPSHDVKKGVLSELGLDAKGIRTRERVGRRLHIVDPDAG